MQPPTIRHSLSDCHSNQPFPLVIGPLRITGYDLIIRLYSTASNFLPSNANPNSCPVPLDSAQEMDAAL